jgi:hypothetical protein
MREREKERERERERDRDTENDAHDVDDDAFAPTVAATLVAATPVAPNVFSAATVVFSFVQACHWGAGRERMCH